MSKRSSRVLRYALINSDYNVVKNNATFKAYYDKKMAESWIHDNALDFSYLVSFLLIHHNIL